jgi:hypothetical protein
VSEREYVYLGDRLTDPRLAGQRCEAVLNSRGKCMTGGSKMLAVFANGEVVIVLRRRLRKWVADA